MKLTKPASKRISLRKGAILAGAVLAGLAAGAALLPTASTPTKLTIAVLLPAIVGALKAAIDYYLHERRNPPLLAILLFAVLAIALGGCVATNFGEVIADPDGSVDVVRYRAVSAAWPLAKIDTSNQSWAYKWGGAENTITTGQYAKGIDSTAQKAIIDTLGPILLELIKASTAAAGIPPSGNPWLDLLELFTRTRDRAALLK